MKKVMVLHGYAQNAYGFSKRLAALRKQCAKDVELVFVDAPHILEAQDLFGDPTVEASGAETDPALTPRGWWRAYRSDKEAVGLEESLEVVRDVLKTDTFDGIFGFSQGGAFAVFITALLERPELYPPFLVDGKPPHPPFKFCISVSGLLTTDPLVAKIVSPPYSTPTLHIMGTADNLVPNARTRELFPLCTHVRVEEHDGGHFVPSKAPWRKFLADYLRDPSADIPSPPAGTGSVPGSGTATPVKGAKKP